MRRKTPFKAYLIFFVASFVLLTIPLHYSIPFKGALLDAITPFWKGMYLFGGRATSKEATASLTIEKLRIEIQDLILENRQLKAVLKEQGFLSGDKPKVSALPAKVLYRSPLFWSNFIIIDGGENVNALQNERVISKGSPVIAEGALVGVVDYVGKRMSRVKLISDEGLQPSVRVVRGKPEEEELLHLLERLILGLKAIEKENTLIPSLKELYSSFKKDEPLFLAKGILQGKSQPLWRSSALELKGIGFNYDFSDQEGPARDLLTGRVEGAFTEESLPLIKEGDLLVTSGLDGVFQEGIPVAYVKSIDKLKEGDFYFSIKAIPCTLHLNSLTDVFVLPSLMLHEENLIQLR